MSEHASESVPPQLFAPIRLPGLGSYPHILTLSTQLSHVYSLLSTHLAATLSKSSLPYLPNSRPQAPLPHSPATTALADMIGSTSTSTPRRSVPASPTKKSKINLDNQVKLQPQPNQVVERERVEGFSFGSVSSTNKPSWMREIYPSGTLPSLVVPTAISASNSRHRTNFSTSVIPSEPAAEFPSTADHLSSSSRSAWMKRKSTFELPSSAASIVPEPRTSVDSTVPSELVSSSQHLVPRTAARHRPNLSTSAIPAAATESVPTQQHLTPSASLLRPLPTPSPSLLARLPPTPPSNAFLGLSTLQDRGATPSLTRLKGRGIVEEQLRRSKMRGDVDEMGMSLGSRESGSIGSTEGRRTDSWQGSNTSRGQPSTEIEPSITTKGQSAVDSGSAFRSSKPPISSTNPSALVPKGVPAARPVLSPPKSTEVKTRDKFFPLRTTNPLQSPVPKPSLATPTTVNSTAFLFSSPRINVKSFVQSVDSSHGSASPQLSQPSPRLGLGISSPGGLSVPFAVGLGKRKPPPPAAPNDGNEQDHQHPFAPPTKSPKSSLRGLARSSSRSQNTPPVPKLQDAFVRPLSVSKDREARRSQASMGRKAGGKAVRDGYDLDEKLPNPWSTFLTTKNSALDRDRSFGNVEVDTPTTPTGPSSTSPPSTTQTRSPVKNAPFNLSTTATASRPAPKSILTPSSLNDHASVESKPPPLKATGLPFNRVGLVLQTVSTIDSSKVTAPVQSPVVVTPTIPTFKTTAGVAVKVKVSKGSPAQEKESIQPLQSQTVQSRQPRLEESKEEPVIQRYELKDEGPAVQRFELKDEGWADPVPAKTGELVHVSLC